MYTHPSSSIPEAIAQRQATAEPDLATASSGRCMAVLTQRSLDRWQDTQGAWQEKLTAPQRVTQCLTWAAAVQTTRPDLARDLQAAAQLLQPVSAGMVIPPYHGR
jgi:hypothetical protein